MSIERVLHHLKLLDFSDEQATKFLELANGNSRYPLPPPLHRLPCANQIRSSTSCLKDDLKTCANCRIVRYCSRDCQLAHWAAHRGDCKHLLLKDSWSPSWIKQGRPPSFFGGDTAVESFGGDQYFWGNIPAIDCLQLEHNEGIARSVTRDFNLCFAASGDIRNLVQTVNGLPEGYSGTLSVLFNDKSPLVVNRNLIILAALISPGTSLDEAAELTMHLMYSAALTKPMAAQLDRLVHIVYGQTHVSRNFADFSQGSVCTRGRGSFTFLQPTTSIAPVLEDFLSSKYTMSEAVKSMHGVMMHPTRVDQRDHHIALLRPSHRLAFMSHRMHGILLPFASSTADFTEPNRYSPILQNLSLISADELSSLMYSSTGQWRLMDSSLVSDGWDMGAVLQIGEACGASPMDLYGCLFFFIKSRLREFALRIQQFRIHICVTQLPASTLSEYLSNNRLPSLWKTPTFFDRIETSNVADYITVQRVLVDWADMLNRHNPSACLMVCSMNWAGELEERQRRAGIDSVQPSHSETAAVKQALGYTQAQAKGDGPLSAAILSAYTLRSVFCESSAEFDACLEYHKTTETAQIFEIRRRVKNRIFPKRHGVSINANDKTVPCPSQEEFYNQFLLGGGEGAVRYLEFEAV